MKRLGESSAVLVAIIGMLATSAAALVGYQSGTNSLAKDYVQIATSILGQKDASPELRQWSAEVLAKHSPVAISPYLQRQLGEQGFKVVALVPEIPVPKFAKDCPDLMAQYPDPSKLSWETLLRAYGVCRVSNNSLVGYLKALNKNSLRQNAKAN